jgi:3-oxoadipate enol-lactonase
MKNLPFYDQHTLTGLRIGMKASLNGTTIYYDDQGNHTSLPVVLIHGFPFNSDMWQSQVELLKENFRVVVYDVRGHGRSDVGDGQYTLELFVDDLITLLDHLNLQKAALCGLSMGGYIALRANERNPERFHALILCDTTSNADSNEAKLRRASAIKSIKSVGVKVYGEEFLKAVLTSQTFSEKKDVVEKVRNMIQAITPVGMCGALLAMVSRTETTQSLSKINVPTLILVGGQDKTTPPELSEKMHELIPNSEIHVVPNAAHLSNLENVTDFNKHLLEFLRRVSQV